VIRRRLQAEFAALAQLALAQQALAGRAVQAGAAGGMQLMLPGSAMPSLALDKLIVMFGRELRESS